MNHIPLALAFLAVMVLFLVFVGVVQLRAVRALELRIKYLEGTTDMVFQSQQHINDLLVAFMENQ